MPGISEGVGMLSPGLAISGVGGQDAREWPLPLLEVASWLWTGAKRWEGSVGVGCHHPLPRDLGQDHPLSRVSPHL